VFEYNDTNEQRAATTRQGIMWMLAGYEVILKEEKKSLFRETSWLRFLK
jgi:hypothetical protein